MEKRRRLSQTLLILALVGLVIFTTSGFPYFASLANWLGLDSQVLQWAIGGVSAVLGLSVMRIWTCENCGNFPGRIDADFCKSCRHPIKGKKILPQATPGEIAERTKNLEHTARRIQKIARWERIAVKGATVIFVLLAVAAYYRYHDLNMALFLGLAGPLLFWGLYHKTSSIFHNLTLLKLKCPSCRVSLIGNYTKYCPGCAHELPDWSAMANSDEESEARRAVRKS